MRVALLALLTGCWSSSQPAPLPLPSPEPVASSTAFRTHTPNNKCHVTVSNMADKLRPELSRTGIPESTIDELVEAAIESCRQTDWSADLLACYDAANDGNDINNCQPLMTTEQSEDMSKRMMEVVSRMTPISPPPPPPTP